MPRPWSPRIAFAGSRPNDLAFAQHASAKALAKETIEYEDSDLVFTFGAGGAVTPVVSDWDGQ